MVRGLLGLADKCVLKEGPAFAEVLAAATRCCAPHAARLAEHSATAEDIILSKRRVSAEFESALESMADAVLVGKYFLLVQSTVRHAPPATAAAMECLRRSFVGIMHEHARLVKAARASGLPVKHGLTLSGPYSVSELRVYHSVLRVVAAWKAAANHSRSSADFLSLPLGEKLVDVTASMNEVFAGFQCDVLVRILLTARPAGRLLLHVNLEVDGPHHDLARSAAFFRLRDRCLQQQAARPSSSSPSSGAGAVALPSSFRVIRLAPGPLTGLDSPQLDALVSSLLAGALRDEATAAAAS
jgi:hypothetical protein